MRCTHALVWLVVVLPLTACETMAVVDRGLYTVAETVTETDRVTGQRSVSLEDRREQIAKGNQSAQQAIAKFDVLNEEVDPRQYVRAVEIFERIHSVSHVKDEHWTVVLVPDPSFNAFVTGGSYVIVNQGLMESLSVDDEVAAVLGHELGHVAANHAFEKISQKRIASLAGTETTQKAIYQAAFTHEQEREADRIGILYAALAGYDPMAAHRIWQRKFEESGNYRVIPGGSVPLHDHPVNSERAAEAAEVAKLVATYYRPGEMNPSADALLRNNALWRYQEDQYAKNAGGGGGALALLSTTLNTYTQHVQAKQEAQRQEYRGRLTKYVDQNTFIVRQGPVNTSTWGAFIQYRGTVSLTRMVVAADFVTADKDHLRIIEEIDGWIKPGGTHLLQFHDDRLAKVDDKAMRVIYTVDDASTPGMR